MADSGDVIVFDEEYAFVANEIGDYGEALVKLIDGYSKSVKSVLEISIKDEKISARLSSIIEQVTSLKSCIDSACKDAKSLCTKYVTEIDAADQFLY